MLKFNTQLFIDSVVINRKERGISQMELSEMTGINRAQISRFENNAFTPSVKQIDAICAALDLNQLDFYTECKK